ncbi:MAG: TetR/AcrR family transcriptional regulator [Pseudonocardia sp.]
MSLRERRKAATRRAIQEQALRLFLADGYEATTVERIAAAAGVSHMTFFRHFPTKESVVEADDYDPVIAELIRGRPSGEAPLVAVREALVGALRAMPAEEVAAVLVRTRLVLRTPALRARMGENQRATQHLFAEALAERENVDPGDLRIQVLAGAALAVLTAALTVWVDAAGGRPLADVVESAFTALAG